jgi:hypothetical protein
MRRYFRVLFRPLFFALCLGLLLPSLRAGADDTLPPTELVSGQLAGIQAGKEILDGPFPGLLLTVRTHDPIFDTRYNQPYRATCCAYIARKSPGSDSVTTYSRRFVVNVPDAEALPTAKRVARLLLMLRGEVQSHLRIDHPGRYQTVAVWMTRRVERGLSPDTGGEQFKDQIYIYDLSADRRAVEWAREVAHEYGHFALVPGAVGFTAPEDDSNGVLGERLFLKWLWTDLHAGRIQAEALPFLTPDLLDTYIALQVTPLLRRLTRDGPDARQLTKRDAEGMDTYIGLLLYLDTLYGSRQLQDIRACTLPSQSGDFVHASDFLRGAVQSLTEAPAETLHLANLSADNKTAVITAYLLHGEYAVRAEGVIVSWQSADPGLHARSQTSLSVVQSGWHRLTMTLNAPPDGATALHLHRTSK